MLRTMRTGTIGVGIAGTFLIAALLAVVFIGRSSEAPPSTRRVLYYRDPMHPSYTSPNPGTAPDCGMALQPVYAEETESGPAPIHVGSQQGQIIGLRLGRVEKAAGTQTIRALGRVTVDESRIFPLIAAADGWVRKVFPNETGSFVRKGQPLVSIYGREYMNTERAYVYAVRALESALRVPAGDYQDDPRFALQEAKLNMQNMGFTEAQIEEVATTRQAVLEVNLCAAGDGLLIARNAFPQQRFERGAELFRIADVSRLWIVADVFGDDVNDIRPGGTARIAIADRPGALGSATVSDTLPKFDPETRAHQVRLSMPNPNLLLRPDMFVDVGFSIAVPPAPVVPSDAVIDSGLGKTVFVQTAPGQFEPRTVTTGRHFDGLVQILTGLAPGETVVVSGNFFLDSESRIQQRPPVEQPAHD